MTMALLPRFNSVISTAYKIKPGPGYRPHIFAYAMITNFEEITATLSTYERDMLVPVLSNFLKTRVGAKYAIRNKEICRIFTERGYQGLTESRVRKLINYIRLNGLVPHLIANSNGYFCATSIEQVETYIESLDQRASAIWAMRSALKRDLTGKLFL